jgi:hypothetical protein
VHVPETTVNEDDFFVFYKNDIRMAGQVAAMQGVTITHSMDDGTNDYFRGSILRPNLGHIERTLFFSKNIHAYKLERA